MISAIRTHSPIRSTRVYHVASHVSFIPFSTDTACNTVISFIPQHRYQDAVMILVIGCCQLLFTHIYSLSTPYRPLRERAAIAISQLVRQCQLSIDI